MTNDALNARLDAIDVLLMGMAQQLLRKELLSDIQEQTAIALTALSNTTATDERIRLLEANVERFVTAMNLR